MLRTLSLLPFFLFLIGCSNEKIPTKKLNTVIKSSVIYKEYKLNILEANGLSKNSDLLDLFKFQKQSRDSLLKDFKSMKISENRFRITDSIAVFGELGTINIFVENRVNYIEMKFQNSDKILMSKLHESMVKHLDKNISKSTQAFAPSTETSFEINNFWKYKNNDIELSHYSDKDNYKILVTIH